MDQLVMDWNTHIKDHPELQQQRAEQVVTLAQNLARLPPGTEYCGEIHEAVWFLLRLCREYGYLLKDCKELPPFAGSYPDYIRPSAGTPVTCLRLTFQKNEKTLIAQTFRENAHGPFWCYALTVKGSIEKFGIAEGMPYDPEKGRNRQWHEKMQLFEPSFHAVARTLEAYDQDGFLTGWIVKVVEKDRYCFVNRSGSLEGKGDHYLSFKNIVPKNETPKAGQKVKFRLQSSEDAKHRDKRTVIAAQLLPEIHPALASRVAAKTPQFEMVLDGQQQPQRLKGRLTIMMNVTMGDIETHLPKDVFFHKNNLRHSHRFTEVSEYAVEFTLGKDTAKDRLVALDVVVLDIAPEDVWCLILMSHPPVVPTQTLQGFRDGEGCFGVVAWVYDRKQSLPAGMEHLRKQRKRIFVPGAGLFFADKDDETGSLVRLKMVCHKGEYVVTEMHKLADALPEFMQDRFSHPQPVLWCLLEEETGERSDRNSKLHWYLFVEPSKGTQCLLFATEGDIWKQAGDTEYMRKEVQNHLWERDLVVVYDQPSGHLYQVRDFKDRSLDVPLNVQEHQILVNHARTYHWIF